MAKAKGKEPSWQGIPKSDWTYWKTCDNPNCNTQFGTHSISNVNCSDECRKEKDRLKKRDRAVLKKRTIECEICHKVVVPVQANQSTCDNPVCKSEQELRRKYETKEAIKKVEAKLSPEDRLALEKQKAQDEAEKKALKDYMRQAAKVDIIVDAIEESIKKRPYTPPVKLIKPLKKPKRPDEDAVLLLSDMHIGEEAMLDEMGGLNEYNFDVFRKRLEELARSIYSFIDIQSAKYNIPKLHIGMLGDNLTGEMIYLGQRNYIDLDLGDQFVEGGEAVVDFIISMLDVFPTVEIDGVVGNHGRVGKKGESKTHVSFDWLWYKYIQKALSKYEDRIKFNFPKSFFVVKNIRGWNFLYQHGEDIISYLRTPYYGMDRDAKDMRDMLQTIGEDFDYICYGHFHESETKELIRGERIVNGSFVGGDLFSTKKLRKISRPSQFCFGVNAKHGISWRYLVYLDKGKPRFKLVREEPKEME